MGVTLTVAVVFWLASSYIEYKIVKSFPATKKMIQHPIGGILLSVGIGFLVGMAIGSQGGLGIFIGQILGLATNNFTFQLYSAMAQLNESAKSLKGDLKDFWVNNKNAMRQLAQSIRTIFHGIAALIKFILLPFKALNWALNKASAS